MKKIVAMLVAGLFSAGVFAQAAPAKKDDKKDAKPAAAAPFSLRPQSYDCPSDSSRAAKISELPRFSQ